MTRAQLSRLMVRAWELARVGARRYGGRALSYIAEALRLAWAERRKRSWSATILTAFAATKTFSQTFAQRWTKQNADSQQVTLHSKLPMRLAITVVSIMQQMLHGIGKNERHTFGTRLQI